MLLFVFPILKNAVRWSVFFKHPGFLVVVDYFKHFPCI